MNLYSQQKKVLNKPNYDKQLLHFGFTIGLDLFDVGLMQSDNFLSSTDNVFDIYNVYSVENQSSMGFHMGPVSNLRLGEYFDLRALIDLSFSHKSLE